MGQAAALTGVLLTLGVEQPPCVTCDKEEANVYGGEHACTDPAAIRAEVDARIREAEQEADRLGAENARLYDFARACEVWGRLAHRAVVAVLDQMGDQMPAEARVSVEQLLRDAPDVLRADVDDPLGSKTETLAKRWTNGPEEAAERLRSALESTSGRVELDARTRYALAFLLVEVATKNGIADRARGWASLWHDRAASYRRSWKTVAAAWDSARAEMSRAWKELDAARAELDALRTEHEATTRGYRAELARLREQTTPRRCGPVAPSKCLVYRAGLWLGVASSTTIAPNEWILPQPSPPPDEPWQEAEQEARAEVRLADAMETPQVITYCSHGSAPGKCMVMGCLHHFEIGPKPASGRSQSPRSTGAPCGLR